MKRLGTIFAALLLCAGLCLVPADAANRVETLTTDVALRADGSAEVTQVFSALTDEGTEFYLDRMDSGTLTYSDLSVSDENGAYEVLPDDTWDIDADFADKAGKCGLLTIDGGVELCWGITEYGRNTYTVSYTISGLAGAYDDADGFLYRFIDPDQSLFPTDALVTVRMADGTPLTEENCGIWAFGFDGEIVFEDGEIHAWTNTPLEGSDYLTVMVELNKGVLSPARTASGSFADVKDRAFAGSDYDMQDDEPLTASDIFWMIALPVGLLAAVFGIYRAAKAHRKAKEKRELARVDYFRDAPNGGDLNVSYALGESLKLCTADSCLSARMLRLVTLGSVEPEEENGRTALRFVCEPHAGDSYDEALYTFLLAAAGGDGVLQETELENFCADERHAETLTKLLESSRNDGCRTLSRTGCLKGTECRRAKDLTPRGEEQRRELLGLKRYLLDFSLLSERDVKETFLWQEYMVYAALLGIAEQVLAQLHELYPEGLTELGQYERYLYSASLYSAPLSRAVEEQRFAEEARSSGGGGFASYGGGGGFSGGGSMGTR